MNTTESVLLIILSSVLAIFLIMGIFVLYKTIQIINHLKDITQKAEKLADQAQHVGEFFQKTGSASAVVKLLSNIVGVFKARANKKGGD